MRLRLLDEWTNPKAMYNDFINMTMYEGNKPVTIDIKSLPIGQKVTIPKHDKK